ncbi:hypothetical protein PG989_011748 [Apiospora arundinis]
MKTSILYFCALAATAFAAPHDAPSPIALVPTSSSSSPSPVDKEVDNTIPVASYGGAPITVPDMPSQSSHDRHCFAKPGHSEPMRDCMDGGSMKHHNRREAGWDDAPEHGLNSVAPPHSTAAVAGAMIGLIVVTLATLAIVMTVFWKCRVARWNRLDAMTDDAEEGGVAPTHNRNVSTAAATQKPLPTVPSSQILTAPPSAHNAPVPMEELISYK